MRTPGTAPGTEDHRHGSTLALVAIALVGPIAVVSAITGSTPVLGVVLAGALLFTTLTVALRTMTHRPSPEPAPPRPAATSRQAERPAPRAVHRPSTVSR